MKQILCCILVVFYMSCTIYGQDQNNTPDSRIKKKLDNLNLSYSLTKQGDFKVTFRLTEEDRTQIVVINSSTYFYKDLELREVRSPVLSCEYKDCNEFSQKQLFTLLEENKNFKLGFWAIHGGTSPYQLLFCLQLDANMEEPVFYEIIKTAAVKADNLEKKLTGEDRF